jgi:hypothetical protein
MQDRPTAAELLDAVEEFLRDRAAQETNRSNRYQLTVASNSLAILRREFESDEMFSREEWKHLDALLEPLALPQGFAELHEGLSSRYDAVCDRIAMGAFDSGPAEDDFIERFLAILTNRVRIANPRAL